MSNSAPFDGLGFKDGTLHMFIGLCLFIEVCSIVANLITFLFKPDYGPTSNFMIPHDGYYTQTVFVRVAPTLLSFAASTAMAMYYGFTLIDWAAFVKVVDPYSGLKDKPFTNDVNYFRWWATAIALPCSAILISILSGGTSVMILFLTCVTTFFIAFALHGLEYEPRVWSTYINMFLVGLVSFLTASSGYAHLSFAQQDSPAPEISWIAVSVGVVLTVVYSLTGLCPSRAYREVSYSTAITTTNVALTVLAVFATASGNAWISDDRALFKQVISIPSPTPQAYSTMARYPRLASKSPTPSHTPTRSLTSTLSASQTGSVSPTHTPTKTVTLTTTGTKSNTKSPTTSPTSSNSGTDTPSQTPTGTDTPTQTQTGSGTPTITPTRTPMYMVLQGMQDSSNAANTRYITKAFNGYAPAGYSDCIVFPNYSAAEASCLSRPACGSVIQKVGAYFTCSVTGALAFDGASQTFLTFTEVTGTPVGNYFTRTLSNSRYSCLEYTSLAYSGFSWPVCAQPGCDEYTVKSIAELQCMNNPICDVIETLPSGNFILKYLVGQPTGGSFTADFVQCELMF